MIYFFSPRVLSVFVSLCKKGLWCLLVGKIKLLFMSFVAGRVFKGEINTFNGNTAPDGSPEMTKILFCETRKKLDFVFWENHLRVIKRLLKLEARL
jgi:hypothetical protein